MSSAVVGQTSGERQPSAQSPRSLRSPSHLAENRRWVIPLLPIRRKDADNLWLIEDSMCMTGSQNLETAEKSWLQDSQEEEFYFASFPEPGRLRRHKSFTGALAELTFGRYQGLDQQWVSDDRAVWLGMITSDSAGQGGRLLDALTRSFGKLGLWVIGTPTPLKPRDWDANRPFEYRVEKLICWYLRHGFKIVQNGSNTRVLHVPLASTLDVNFTLK